MQLPSEQAVIAATAKHYRLGANVLIGTQRTREVRDARRTAAYVMRHYLGKSYPEIADALHRASHSTMQKALEKLPDAQGVVRVWALANGMEAK